MNGYSKNHEREEREKMGRGLWHSLFGLFFCWVPGLGLLLSISGFIRQMVRLTVKHRARLAVYLTFSIISLVICVGALIGEAFLYSRNPNVVGEAGHIVWEALTGQTEYPWEQPEVEGFDYTGYSQPGLGVMDDMLPDPEDETPPPEEDIYYGDDGVDEEFIPDEADDTDLTDGEFDDEDFADDEEAEDPEFDQLEELPDIKDIMNDIKNNPENLLLP